MEKGFTAAVKKKLQEAKIRISTTAGYGSKGNSTAERTNRKAREYQRIMLLDAVGRRNLYTELGAEAMIHGIYSDNFRPE